MVAAKPSRLLDMCGHLRVRWTRRADLELNPHFHQLRERAREPAGWRLPMRSATIIGAHANTDSDNLS